MLKYQLYIVDSDEELNEESSEPGSLTPITEEVPTIGDFYHSACTRDFWQAMNERC